MATFVLVHGSWHNGTAWQPTIQHLEDKGHVPVEALVARPIDNAHAARANLFGYEIVPEPLTNHFPLLHSGPYCMAGGPRFGKNLIAHAKQTNFFSRSFRHLATVQLSNLEG